MPVVWSLVMAKLVRVLPIVILSVVLTGCASTSTQSDHSPEVSTPAPTPSSVDTSTARDTGEVVGEQLRDGWEVSKAFGQGLWSTLTEDRE